MSRIIENNEDDETSYHLIKEALQEDPGLMGICFARAGHEGGLRAIKELGLGGVLRVVTYDMTDVVKKNLKGKRDFCNGVPEPYKQGYLGVDILGKYLLTRKRPAETCVYMHIYIATKYTLLDFSLQFVKRKKYHEIVCEHVLAFRKNRGGQNIQNSSVFRGVFVQSGAIIRWRKYFR